MGDTSRVSREAQARICERLGVKFPGPTRPFRPWSLTGSGREQQSVFPLDQRPMKAQQRRRSDSDRNLWEAFGRHQEGTDAEQ